MELEIVEYELIVKLAEFTQDFFLQISYLNVFLGMLIYHRGFGNIQSGIRHQNEYKNLSWFSFSLSALYSLAAFFIFILLPFMYFYFEEKDDGNVTVKEVHFEVFSLFIREFLFVGVSTSGVN